MTFSNLRRPSLAVYPPLVAAAFVLNEFAVSNAPLEALARPLAVAVGAGVLVQLLVSVVVWNGDRGAFFTLVILLVLIGLPELALVLMTGLTVAVFVAMRRGIGLQALPWPRGTRILNVVAGLTLALVIGGAGIDGALSLSGGSPASPPGRAATGLPDIYLIMLDGYPRSDTLRSDFGMDNGPFLRSMQSLGFDLAEASHSNYTMTVLTLASVVNGAHVATLMPDPPKSVSGQFRAVSRLINRGSKLQAFRDAGFEIVSIPSGYYEGTLLSVDRYLDSGELSTFEMGLLRTGGMRLILAGSNSSWSPDQHRARIRTAFTAVGDLAAERAARPKLVLAHLMAPHMPIAFTKDGGAAPPLPCFPAACSLYDFGDAYGDARIEPMRGQIEWVNSAVEQTVRTIQAQSENPPVIVVFSDHGLRFRNGDRDELFRSLFLSVTPDRDDVFPDDVTPVNMLTRLLNAYTNSDLSLSSEESYWSETRDVGTTGLFQLELWHGSSADGGRRVGSN